MTIAFDCFDRNTQQLVARSAVDMTNITISCLPVPGGNIASNPSSDSNDQDIIEIYPTEHFTGSATLRIQDDENNVTRFLVMGKSIHQPDLKKKKYITSFLFKLKSKPAALYQSLGGFAINGVNLTKLQSYPEKNSFESFFFLCDLDGHIEDKKVQKSLEELGLHCQDFHVLGVFEADPARERKS